MDPLEIDVAFLQGTARIESFQHNLASLELDVLRFLFEHKNLVLSLPYGFD